MKKVKQSPRSDQPASWRSSKAAMRRSNVPRGHQEGAWKRRRRTRRRSRSRSIQPPPQMRDCLCCEPYLKQAFASSRNLAATQGLDPGKAILGPPNASLCSRHQARGSTRTTPPRPWPRRRPLSLPQAREDRSQITTLTAHAWRPPAVDRRELEEAAPFGAKRPTLWRSTFQPRATHRSARASPRPARDAPVGGPWRRRRAHCRPVRRAQYRDQSSEQKCPCFKLPKLERAAASGQTPMGIPSMAGLSPLV
jgi:hypothetical protein